MTETSHLTAHELAVKVAELEEEIKYYSGFSYTKKCGEIPDGCFELMADLAAALYAAVNAKKLNEADVINQDGRRHELGALLDRAESLLTKTHQAQDPSHD